MTLWLVVLCAAVIAAIVLFTFSASRQLPDPVDPNAEARAARRSLLRHPKVLRFLRERFDRKSAGGFMLTVGLLIVFTVAFVIGMVLDLIDNNHFLSSADRSVAAWGAQHPASASVSVLKAVTRLGSTPVVFVALGATAMIDFARRHNKEVFAFVGAVGIGELALNNGLKLLVARDRPNVLHLVGAHGYSFPSGHTVAASACWSAIALVASRGRSRRVRALFAAGAGLIAVGVATSRALLGVHWLSDVIAGLVFGWGWFTLVAVIFGGRAQRLGDPVTATPAGTAPPPDEAQPEQPDHASSGERR